MMFRQRIKDTSYVFGSLAEARRIIEAWRIDYNAVRPHSSLAYQTPEEFAAAWAKAQRSDIAPLASACQRARGRQGRASGALRASLTAPARDGAERLRPGRKNGSVWGRTEEWDGRRQQPH